MLWVTRSHLHLDRVATPWLITRFVDPAAEFVFAGWDGGPPEGDGMIAFGFPGIELSSHDERGTCFRKVLIRYDIADPALELMERIVASGVAHAMGTEPPADQTDDELALGTALDLLGSGLGIAFDDEEHLAASMAVYDALFAWCQVMVLSADVRAGAPAPLPARVPYLRRAIGRAAAP